MSVPGPHEEVMENKGYSTTFWAKFTGLLVQMTYALVTHVLVTHVLVTHILVTHVLVTHVLVTHVLVTHVRSRTHMFG